MQVANAVRMKNCRDLGKRQCLISPSQLSSTANYYYWLTSLMLSLTHVPTDKMKMLQQSAELRLEIIHLTKHPVPLKKKEGKKVERPVLSINFHMWNQS